MMPAVTGPRHQAQAARLRRMLSVWERQRDLVALGAYAAGSDPETDEALAHVGAIEAFLRQGRGEASTLEQAVAALEGLLG